MSEFNRYKFEIFPIRDEDRKLAGFTLSTDFYGMDNDTHFLIYLSGQVDMVSGNNLLPNVDLRTQFINLGYEIIEHKKKQHNKQSGD